MSNKKEIRSVADALEHLNWTFRHSPKTAAMFKDQMEKTMELFNKSLEKAEGAT